MRLNGNGRDYESRSLLGGLGRIELQRTMQQYLTADRTWLLTGIRFDYPGCQFVAVWL
jgi:hypothetical protein